MDLSVIEISKEEATERLAEYTEALRTERNAEDEAIAAGYRPMVHPTASPGSPTAGGMPPQVHAAGLGRCSSGAQPQAPG